MECQDVRQLLAFLERKSEELDAAEHDALQKHLDACPDCAALAAADRSADQAIGVAVRAVAVPAGLKQQVLQRLATERGGVPWKRWAGLAAAMLLALAGGIAWNSLPKPDFIIEENRDWEKGDVEEYLKEQGFPAKAPGKLKYNLLRQVDVISYKGRPVARLSFLSDNGVDSATVFVVDTKHLNPKFDGDPSIRPLEVEDAGRFKYIIRCRGDDAWLMHPLQ